VKAVVEEGEIRISIDIDALAYAIENGPVSDTYGTVLVTERETLARWLADRLTSDGHDGVCELGELVERVVGLAIGNGEQDDMGLDGEEAA
jgi:hypothetical protein